MPARDRGAQPHRAAHAVPLADLDAVALADAERLGVGRRELGHLLRARTKCSAGETSTSLEAHSGRNVPSRSVPSRAGGAPSRDLELDRLPGGRDEVSRSTPAHAAAADLLERDALVERHGLEQPARDLRAGAAVAGSWPSARAMSVMTCHSGRTPCRAGRRRARGRSPGAAAARAVRDARACLPSRGRPRRGRRRRRARGSCRVSCESTAITVCAVPAPVPQRAVRVACAAGRRGAARRVCSSPLASPSAIPCASSPGAASERSRGRGRGRSRPRACRGRSA